MFKNAIKNVENIDPVVELALPDCPYLDGFQEVCQIMMIALMSQFDLLDQRLAIWRLNGKWAS